MGKKQIVIELSSSGIQNAIAQLREYQVQIRQKEERLKQKVAEFIKDKASAYFAQAVVDDLVSGSFRLADVDVQIQPDGNTILIIASGEDAIWAEFGTGVYHNHTVGSSLHPKGKELGFTIGEYGKGRGKRKVWGFQKDGEFYLTRGATTSMPMYRSVQDMRQMFEAIAREVFT